MADSINNTDSIWVDKYGVTYSADRRCLIKAPAGLEVYTVLDGTQIIAKNAFSAKTVNDSTRKLKSIVLPDSLEVIGPFAFAGNKLLKTIVIPDNVSSIGKGAFMLCEELNSIHLPNKITIIPENTFLYSKLEHIEIPPNVILIEHMAFVYCKDLKTITFYKENKPYIDTGAFVGCDSLNTFIIVDENSKSTKYGFQYHFKLAGY